jgi:enoyl-CoA hydratase
MGYERYRCLATERRGKVLVIAFDRPAALNSITAELHRELSEIFADVARDSETEAVVLTGNGRAFSAGGDLRWFQNMRPPELDALFFEARKIIVDFLEVEQPVIAAVNGAATGLGATLALFSDVIFASDAARIGDPHVRIGVVAGDGGAIIWPWLVGAARAKEFLMTGDLLTAEEAYRIGLVNHVVPADELMQKALALADRLANGPTQAIRGTKVSVNKILRETVNLVLDTSLALEKLCFTTADHREAIDAFLEKREPKFSGRR